MCQFHYKIWNVNLQASHKHTRPHTNKYNKIARANHPHTHTSHIKKEIKCSKMKYNRNKNPTKRQAHEVNLCVKSTKGFIDTEKMKTLQMPTRPNTLSIHLWIISAEPYYRYRNLSVPLLSTPFLLLLLSPPLLPILLIKISWFMHEKHHHGNGIYVAWRSFCIRLCLHFFDIRNWWCHGEMVFIQFLECQNWIDE